MNVRENHSRMASPEIQATKQNVDEQNENRKMSNINPFKIRHLTQML
jgi:hypothetical protein